MDREGHSSRFLDIRLLFPSGILDRNVAELCAAHEVRHRYGAVQLYHRANTVGGACPATTAWGSHHDYPDGAYIRGLFLEGARWDSEQGSLNDSRPKQLYTPLPVLHLDPEQHRKNPDKGVYRCPVYKVLSRRGTLSTTGHSTNFVMWIDLPSNRADFINNAGSSDQETWVKAGVAAFSSLKY
ncbi:unnamed protein product [Laminaria digitata]